MIYPLQNRKKNDKKFLPITVVAIFIAIAFVFTLFVPTFFPSMAHGIGRPIWLFGNFFTNKTINLKAFIFSRQSLIEKNRNLSAQLLDAQTRLTALSVLEKENQSLKESWGRNFDEKKLLASILVKPPRSAYDTFVLDVGESLGVKVGDSIVFGDTVILGYIDEVFGKTSRAKLFSSVDTETSATVDRNGITVTLIGKGSGNFEIKAPKEVDILKGDTLMLPGIVPHTVGIVVEIESNPANSFKRVFCTTPVNISEIRLVSVVKQ